jgi:DNA repair protein RecO (recombination protein O)
MAHTYRATGINLKSMAMGEHDRLLTILTKEHGLIKAIAAGARKHRSSMSGRSGLFVVNELQISQGRSLDRITQAETVHSFVGLGKNLAKLTAAQYLAELALFQALTAHPQAELFLLLTEHLMRLQQVNEVRPILACLNHGIYHLLAIAGVAPQVHNCCFSQQPVVLISDNPKWQVGFSIAGGGIVDLKTKFDLSNAKISHHLTAQDLKALQELTQVDLSNDIVNVHVSAWLTVERLLRAYAQYHFDRPIQSAALIDSCFTL